MKLAQASAPRRPFAGILATATAVRATAADRHGSSADEVFALSLAGLAAMNDWLATQGVTHVALLQGASAWPWQAEGVRRRQVVGPMNLAYWLEYQGAAALETVPDEAAWQPVMLALRESFALFLVRPQADGGPYPVAVNRNTPRQLATMLADGSFIAEFPKQALLRLIEAMATDTTALAECLSFFLAESRGHWHNRARAKIARRLKHCAIDPATQEHLVQTIGGRLLAGNFTEQFRDQLRLMLHLDRAAAMAAGTQALQSAAPHVQRYGAWLVDRATNAVP